MNMRTGKVKKKLGTGNCLEIKEAHDNFERERRICTI